MTKTFSSQIRVSHRVATLLGKCASAVVLLTLACLQPALADDESFDDIDTFLADLANTGAFSGAVALVVGGRVVLSEGYGLANIEHAVPNSSGTRFQIGSITKQFTAAAILLLHEEGKLNIADTVGEYLPDLPLDWQPLSIHQLLNHTSGLHHPWRLEGFEERMMVPRTRDEVLAMYEGLPLLSEPGTEYHYSGHGYYLLTMIIDRASGKPYHEYLQSAVFDPLEMHNTGADSQARIIPGRASGYALVDGTVINSAPIYMPTLTGGGDLYSTVEDLIRWHAGLRPGVLLSRDSLEQMLKPGLRDYGYGWRIQTHDSIRMALHTGGTPGFISLIMRFPELDSCIIILSNNADNEFNSILDKVVGRVIEASAADSQ